MEYAICLLESQTRIIFIFESVGYALNTVVCGFGFGWMVAIAIVECTKDTKYE